MPYTFEAFLEKQPYESRLSRFEDDGKERGVFSSRWKLESFASLLDFQIFLFQYSSLLQPYIHEIRGEDLAGYFKSETNPERAARAFHAEHPETQLDAKNWCEQELGFADFSWLKPGDHNTIQEFEIEGYAEMVARGPAGYMTVFVADLLQ